MNPTAESSAFGRAVSPVLQQVISLDETQTEIRFKTDPALKDRIEELASKANEGNLSEQERGEYQGYVRANKFVATLQLQLRRAMNSYS
jgi:hypothetical protein